jgi:predicted O-methyltransferase YrrM
MHARALLDLANYHPRRYPYELSTVWAELKGALDRAPARRYFPELEPEELATAGRELAADHARYATGVSTPDYAISLELASFLLRLCRDRRPARLVDLGSGFSSFVFRRYQAGDPGDPEVWSVDDDAAWLERTASYLDDHGLRTDRLLPLAAFLASGEREFDLVLHDLNSINSPARSALLPIALELASPSGVVVIDDLHGYPYRSRVRAACRRAGLPLANLRAHLMDESRRYPGAVPPGGRMSSSRP